MNNNPQKQLDLATIFIVTFVTVLGLLVRLVYILPLEMPVNDGGLFYTMILDLQANQYRLPVFSSYNQAYIPFAYPPLAFYMAGSLNRIFEWDLTGIIRLLPIFINTLTIPIFYILARKILRTPAHAMIAVTAFAFAPRGFDWLIMGGGLTRSLGFLFSVATILGIHELLRNSSVRSIIFTSLMAALTILSHAEMSLHTMITAVVFLIFWGRSKKAIISYIWVASLTIVLTSPWWYTVISWHGFGPFLAASQIGARSLFFWPLLLFRFDLSLEPFMTLISALGFLGMFLVIRERKFFLPIWLLAYFLSDPRGAPLFTILPLCLLAGITVVELVMPALGSKYKTDNDLEHVSSGIQWAENLLSSRLSKAFYALLMLHFMMSAMTAAYVLVNSNNIQDAELDAFDWVRRNTLSSSKFALITGEEPLLDSFSEWFPALTSRVSLATTQGYEWIPGKIFNQRLLDYSLLQKCAAQGIDCIQNWERETGQMADYILLKSQNPKDEPISTGEVYNYSLAYALSESSDYRLVYQNERITIFKKLSP